MIEMKLEFKETTLGLPKRLKYELEITQNKFGPN